jgi:condensin complex subunit 1
MIVLSHLILNNMIKIKGEMCNIAILFEDPSDELQNLAQVFFNEINKKDPRFIYNMLPEAITKLSNNEGSFNGAPVTEKTFQCFAKNILGMLDKNKSSEGLIEKLCLRFDNTSNIWDLRNTAYCISQLNLSDKALRMLLHHYEHIQPRMYDGEISNCFKVLLNKVTSLIKRS